MPTLSARLRTPSVFSVALASTLLLTFGFVAPALSQPGDSDTTIENVPSESLIATPVNPNGITSLYQSRGRLFRTDKASYTFETSHLNEGYVDEHQFLMKPIGLGTYQTYVTDSENQRELCLTVEGLPATSGPARSRNINESPPITLSEKTPSMKIHPPRNLTADERAALDDYDKVTYYWDHRRHPILEGSTTHPNLTPASWQITCDIHDRSNNELLANEEKSSKWLTSLDTQPPDTPPIYDWPASEPPPKHHVLTKWWQELMAHFNPIAEESEKAQVDPKVLASELNLCEINNALPREIGAWQVQRFDMDSYVTRIAVCDASIAVAVPREDGFYLVSRNPGNTNVFVWGEHGSVCNLELHVKDAVGGAPQKTDEVRPAAELLQVCPKLVQKEGAELWFALMDSCGESDYFSTTVLMPKSVCATATATTATTTTNVSDSESKQIKDLTNSATKALHEKNIREAVRLFQQALELDPCNEQARQGYANTFDDYGVRQRSLGQMERASEMFHFASFMNPNDTTIRSNLEKSIRAQGYDPHKFADRIAIGDHNHDRKLMSAALVEYYAALQIHDDLETRIKIMNIGYGG